MKSMEELENKQGKKEKRFEKERMRKCGTKWKMIEDNLLFLHWAHTYIII